MITAIDWSDMPVEAAATDAEAMFDIMTSDSQVKLACGGPAYPTGRPAGCAI
jgi:hypothetical protein